MCPIINTTAALLVCQQVQQCFCFYSVAIGKMVGAPQISAGRARVYVSASHDCSGVTTFNPEVVA